MTSRADIAAAKPEATDKSDRSDTDNQRYRRSELEIIIKTGDALGKIREVAQGSRDKMLLYFIDMAIFQVCESLRSELGASAAPSGEAAVG